MKNSKKAKNDSKTEKNFQKYSTFHFQNRCSLARVSCRTQTFVEAQANLCDKNLAFEINEFQCNLVTMKNVHEGEEILFCRKIGRWRAIR